MTYQCADEKQAKKIFKWMVKQLHWESVISFSIFRRKWERTPRFQCAFSEKGVQIWYNDTPAYCYPHNEFSKDFIARIKELSGFEGNYVLLNWYFTGRECIAQHSDSTRGLVKSCPIVMISFFEDGQHSRPMKATRLKISERIKTVQG